MRARFQQLAHNRITTLQAAVVSRPLCWEIMYFRTTNYLLKRPESMTGSISQATRLLDRGRDTSCLVPPARTRTSAH
jgi:hypothetical protein